VTRYLTPGRCQPFGKSMTSAGTTIRKSSSPGSTRDICFRASRLIIVLSCARSSRLWRSERRCSSWDNSCFACSILFPWSLYRWSGRKVAAARAIAAATTTKARVLRPSWPRRNLAPSDAALRNRVGLFLDCSLRAVLSCVLPKGSVNRQRFLTQIGGGLT